MAILADGKTDPIKDFNNYYQFKEQENASCKLLRLINYHLVKFFYLFGYTVGKYPLYFVIIPTLLSIALVTGVFFMKYEEQPTLLFVPYVAPFLREQKIIESHYPINYSYGYDPVRFTRYEGHSRILISSKDGESIFRSKLWPEIIGLDESIRKLKITLENGDELAYQELCSKWRGECMANPALNINEIVGEIENGTTKINYPMMLVPLIVPQVLGGAVINRSAGVIEDAKAVVLGFFLNIESPEKIELAQEWELELLNYLKNVNFEHIRISFYTSRTLQDELRVKMDSSLPYIPVTGFLMVTVCMGLLWTSDCVRSKPLIGLVGIISAIMSAGAAFGFLVYCGAIYTRLNVVCLFLILGIGVDDIFVAISAWQKTSIKDSVPKRLAHTYADAAVSVTITSLTNALAFAVGISTPVLIVMSFCLFSCVSIIFAYVWFVTFCGGFLALAGYMEKAGRHCLLFVKARDAPNNASSLTRKFYYLICSSPSHGVNATKREETQSHIVSVFFRDYVGSLLCSKTFKVGALLVYIVYLTGALYGLTVLKEGMYRHRMARDDSYLAQFSLDDDHLFRQLPYSVQVVVEGNLSYSDPVTQKKLLDLKKTYESSPYGAETIYSQFWLSSFFKRLERRRDWQEMIKDEDTFIKVVREKFLVNPNNKHWLDIRFNENNTRIIASRMIIQTASVKNIQDDVDMMYTFRKISAESEFNVTSFHLLYSLFDQHSLLRPLTVQSIIVAIILVIIVALFFIPDIRGSFAIAYSVLSIAIGVLGYMAYWNVNLDHVSSGSIFMCIGFSVDFSAHITYTYLSSREKTSEGKIKDTLHSLGLPILQGGLTTIVSLVTFMFIPGYGYRTFFKTIFLVTLFASFHSIILIPLVLSATEVLFSRCRKRNFKEKSEFAKSSVKGISGTTFKQICTDLSTTINEIPTTQTEIPNGKANNEHRITMSNGKLKEEHNSKMPNGGTSRALESSKDNDFEKGVQNEGFEHDET